MALVDRTNECRQPRSPRSRPPSPIPMGKALRRKESVRGLSASAGSLNSLSSLPSSHSSIYDALPARPDNPTPDQNPPLMSGALVPSVLSSQSIHIPHKLETIIEQKSFASLQQSNLSLKQKASVLSQLARKTSLRTLVSRAGSRRRFAFSVSDMTFFRSFRRFLQQSISSVTSNSSRHFENSQAYPMGPVEDPPERLPTPPGLPTFNTREAAQFKLPPPRLRCRDTFRCRHSARQEWLEQTEMLPKGAVMRGQGGFYVRGTWKKPVSGHFYVPRTRARNFRDANGFHTRSVRSSHNSNHPFYSGRSSLRAPAPVPVPSRYNDGIAGISTVPPAVPLRESSRRNKIQPEVPKRRLSSLCCCIENDESIRENSSWSRDRGSIEDENLEALRLAISGPAPPT